MNFKVKTTDKCVWLIDQKEEPYIEIHMTVEQAAAIGVTLVMFAGEAEYGKDQEADID